LWVVTNPTESGSIIPLNNSSTSVFFMVHVTVYLMVGFLPARTPPVPRAAGCAAVPGSGWQGYPPRKFGNEIEAALIKHHKT